MSADRADVFLQAAEREDDSATRAYSACCSITSVVRPDQTFNISPEDIWSWPKEARTFWEYFSPGDRKRLFFWNSDEQHERVLALCFMAAMVEAGDA